ncbi:MAG: hypothetical protein OQK13_01925, partial [Gammaproteobacteria bacterium]|nr:hypothetical protein [Gammaproteobacteria bacterium]
MLTRKLENKFLKLLYERHVKKYGESIVKLPESEFHVLDTSFVDTIPALRVTNEESYKHLTNEIVRELERKELISTKS